MMTTDRRQFLRERGFFIAATVGGRWAGADGDPPAKRPNFVFILVDDLGWHDVGFMGNEFVETPQLDRLAKDGVVLTAAYANAPNCAPTRASLMTGQYTPRHGIYTVSDESNQATKRQQLIPRPSSDCLPDDSITIAEALKSAGYATACFGMWNLGLLRDPKHSPAAEGFDVYKAPADLGFGDPKSYFPAALVGRDGRQKGEAAPAGQYLTDRLTDEAVAFIKAKGDEPFFLYLAHHAVHTPHDPKPDLLAKYEMKTTGGAKGYPVYAAMVESVDQSVGRMLDTLARLDLTDDTLVIFFSDNGGEVVALRSWRQQQAEDGNVTGGPRASTVRRHDFLALAGTGAAALLRRKVSCTTEDRTQSLPRVDPLH